jgi:hypothetical protein
MREVAKSIFWFSWAVSLFGLQQVSKLMAPSADQGAAATEFDEVSRIVQSHLSESAAEQFKAADQWQRRVVDAVFDAGALQSFDPRRAAEVMDPRAVVKSSVDFVQASVETVRRTVQPTPAPAAPEAAQ